MLTNIMFPLYSSIYVIQLIESVGSGPITHGGIFTSTCTEGEALTSFIVVICHVTSKEEWVESHLNRVITLECALERLGVNL